MAPPAVRLSDVCRRLHESKELRWRLLMLFAFAVGSLTASAGNLSNEHNWQLLFWYSALLVVSAQFSDTVAAFFVGEGSSIMDTVRHILYGVEYGSMVMVSPGSKHSQEARRSVGFWTLMPSAFITWIFAKSINNAAVLGGRFGILGGVAYAGWYTSFWAAGFVGYWLRTRHGVRSLPQVIEKVFGSSANVCFGLALFFRLWNEVWSNIIVVAQFYGAPYSKPWWVAAIISASVPATYVFMGGMRASLVSDVLQAALALIFLFVILGRIGHEMGSATPSEDIWEWEPPTGWLPGGGWCLLAALLQGFVSYPFHDPVLTDRAFLSRPRTMLAALFVGGAISMMFIILFSAVGIYACYITNSVGNGAPTVVSSHLGGVMESFITLVMMTSSLSTLDSTFTSSAKLFALEMMGHLKLPGDKRPPDVRGPLTARDASVNAIHVALGRVAILFVCVLGTIFLEVGRETDALKATTVSGTMVMGLGPPVYLACFWKYNSTPGAADGWRKAPLAFLGSFCPGVVFGICYAAATWRVPDPTLKRALESVAMGEGMYDKFLGWNVVGHCVCLAGSLIGFAIHQLFKLGSPVDAEATVEAPVTGHRVPRAGYEMVAATELQDKSAAADAVFDRVAGADAKTVDVKALTDYLVQSKMPLEHVQMTMNALSVNEESTIDRLEFQTGFNPALMPRISAMA